VIGQAERLLRDVRFGELACRRAAFAWRARKYLPLAHALAAPKRIEYFVEAFPIGMGRAEQRAQRRLER
jgi:hypothetical protein